MLSNSKKCINDNEEDIDPILLQDYLKTKIEQRPNRESLVQKNILTDSKVAPSLQDHERRLKRARLAGDLNDKLLNRPGPLELLEHGILVSDNSTLNEAIKDGKIVFPKTSELKLNNNPYFIDDQNDENDSNSSNSAGFSTFNSTLSPSAATQSSIDFSNNEFSAKTTITSSSSNNFADLFKSIPSPTNSVNEQKVSNDIADASANIVTNSFLNNYQPTNTKSLKIRPRKLNQLIFHEYKGPNQKSTTSKANKKPSTPTNNNSFNISNNNNCFNFNYNDVNNSIKANELNSYKIRLEQQKVYLSYDESVNQKADQSTPVTLANTTNSAPSTISTPLQTTNNNSIMTIKQLTRQNTQTSLVTQIPILPQPNTNNTNNTTSLIQPQQQIIPIQTASTNTNSTTQSIQILPINSFQIPDNLKTILNSPQILSIISTPSTNGTTQLATLTNKATNNCIAIQPSPATTNMQTTTLTQQTQQQQQHQTQFASILPLTSIQQTTANDTQKIILNSNDQQLTGNKQNLTLLLPATTTNTNNQTVQQLISSLPVTTTTATTSSSSPSTTTNTNTKSTNIEDMTKAELIEECRKKKLHVSGNKQQLIERIKTNMSNLVTPTTIMQQTSQLQIAKSPDSGVGNMEYSPSFPSSVLGDHSPRSVASLSFNANSRPPSVHNNLNNLSDIQNINNGTIILSPTIGTKIINNFSEEDHINEERIKIERQIEELHRQLNLLNSNCKQNNNNDNSISKNNQNVPITVNQELLDYNDINNKNILNNVFIKSESNNDTNKDIRNFSNKINGINNNNYNKTIGTTSTTTTTVLNNNLIKTLTMQPIEQQQQQQQKQSNNHRQSTIKQLAIKQKPIKILCNSNTTSIKSPTTTTITTTNSITNNNNNNNSDSIKNNKLRQINSMPTMINNLNGFNNVTKAVSSKSIDTPQYLIHINIPIIKENNFDNHLTLPLTPQNQISSTAAPPTTMTTTTTITTTKASNNNSITNYNNTIPKINNNTIITQLQQKPLISNVNQQQLINIIQTNSNISSNNNINNNQQQLPSISSFINSNTINGINNNNNNNFIINNNDTNDTKLPSIGTFSNKLKLKTEQDNNNSIETSLLNYNSEMEWNDTGFLFYNTNYTTNNNNNNNLNHNTTTNNHVNSIEVSDEILFNFDVFENSSTTNTSNINNKNNDDLLSVNEFLTTTTTTATQISNNQQNHDDHILFSIDNDNTFFNHTNNDNHHQQQQQQHCVLEQNNKEIMNHLAENQQQQFMNNLSNQFNIDNIFNDNTFLTLQDNGNNLENNINMNMNINGNNNDNRSTYYDPINLNFDSIDNDFVQYNYLESPIV